MAPRGGSPNKGRGTGAGDNARGGARGGAPGGSRGGARAGGRTGAGRPGEGRPSRGGASRGQAGRDRGRGGEGGRGPGGRGGEGGRSQGPRSQGPRASGSRSAGPRGSGPRSSGPRSAGPRSAGPRGSGPRSAGPRGSGPRDRNARDRNARDRSPRDKGLGGEQLEGRQAVREALIAGRRTVREIWIANDIDGSDIIDDIRELAQAHRVQVFDVPRRRLEDYARSEAPQGVIALAAPLTEANLDELLQTRDGMKPFLVAIDGVTDPGNFGALLRCCDGAGVTGVVVPRHRSVHVTPTVVKTSAGAVEYVPLALVAGLPAALTQMREAGVWVVGLDDGVDKTLFDIGDLAADAVCVVLGAEGAGLSRLVRERCDMVVSIPMHGQLSSLNVSAAAALATYEVSRVRARNN